MAVAFEILPGLPGTGPYPEQFSTHGGTYREGFVVRVIPEHGEPWVGNFQPYLENVYRSSVFKHPDGHVLVVVAGGSVYVVDANTRRLVQSFKSTVREPEVVASEEAVILATNTEIIAIGRDKAWVSPRVALDGIKELRMEGTRLTAKGWFEPDEPPRRIEIDMVTHEVLASAF